MKIQTHVDLIVYQKARDAAMSLFQYSQQFPKNEDYALTDQVRRSSRSVCANLAEAWRKRRYERAFVAKLSDAEAEAAETQVWVEFAVRCGYLPTEEGRRLYRTYDEIIRTIVGMIQHRDTWIIQEPTDSYIINEETAVYNAPF